MAISLTATVSPALRVRYLTYLKTYAGLKAQRDALDAALKDVKGHVQALLDETGDTAIAIDGYKTTLVAPVRESLDKQRLLELGVSIDVLKAATVQSSSTPYLKITVPNGSNDE